MRQVDLCELQASQGYAEKSSPKKTLKKKKKKDQCETLKSLRSGWVTQQDLVSQNKSEQKERM